MTSSIRQAKEAMEEGGLVAFPAEIAYGIAADALNKEAVENKNELGEVSS
jgi:tRNA A37 threonylcarbamoyladenosine synthetase subunit TsaC/SUA5/YrdC